MSAGGMVRVFFEFLLGFLLYLVRGDLPQKCFAPKIVLDCYGVVLLALLSATFLGLLAWPIFVPVAALFVLHLSEDRGWVVWLFSAVPLVFLGEISYSLYMWHCLIIQCHNVAIDRLSMGPLGPTEMTLMSLSMLGCSLAAATASYHWLERPARDVLNRRLPPSMGSTR
jgi:peptidoglycan/LPS O-acetylase OafA/YrhL